MVVRKHSIFGDYILVDKRHSLGSEAKDGLIVEIESYNILWRRYSSEIGWSSIPTEEGFIKWLQKHNKRKEEQNAE